MKRLVAALLLAAMTMPAPVGAETAARSLEELGRRVKPGQKVQVLERSGRITEGVIVELSESSLTLSYGQPVTFAVDDVVRVDRAGDSVRNGILIGAASGAAVGVLVVLTGPSLSDEEIFDAVAVGGYVVFGAGLGWLIDALKKGHTPLYEAPLTRPKRTSVNVAPIIGKGRRGLAVAVRF